MVRMRDTRDAERNLRLARATAVAARVGLIAISLFGAAALSATAKPTSPAAPMPATAAAATGLPALLADLQAIAATSGGTVGVAAWRLDGTGPRVLLNGSEQFPMASTFKVAVAGAVLARVDGGSVRLTDMVTVSLERMVPSEVLADRFIHPGVSLSVYNLLELMLNQSDNTATDLMTELSGGPAAVTAWVRAQHVEGQRIDRDTAGIIREFFGLPAGPIGAAYEAASKADPRFAEKDSHPNAAFDDDPRDTTTPEAMASLLTQIFNGRALSADSTALLMAIMERCRTGVGRLKGRLPAGTVVAHKTGTIGGTVNDAGVITLPGTGGKIVVAVYIKKSDAPIELRERAIADIARSVRDYFHYGAGH